MIEKEDLFLAIEFHLSNVDGMVETENFYLANTTLKKKFFSQE